MMGPEGLKSDVNEPGVKRRQLRILLAWRCEGAVPSVPLSVVQTTKDRTFQNGVKKCVIKALTL
jgi:hypothetical protein